MRFLLWGLAAVALLATEPGKRLQKKAADAFKQLKDKVHCESVKTEQEEPRIFGESTEDKAEPEIETETEPKKEDEHGLDQEKAEELIEKLNAKPSAPEGELKSA